MAVLLSALLKVVMVISIFRISSVRGIPVPDRQPRGRNDATMGAVDGDIENGITSFTQMPPIDYHLECRSCKRLVINIRYALLIDRGEISDYFTDQCLTIFEDHVDRENCELLIQYQVQNVIIVLVAFAHPDYICKSVLHVCTTEGGPTPTDQRLRDKFKWKSPSPSVELSALQRRIMTTILNGTDNELPSPSHHIDDIINFHVACRSCKQIVINARFAMDTEKTAISNYFTDPCTEFFGDQTDIQNCKLVIQEKVDTVYGDIFKYLDPVFLCNTLLDMCPAETNQDVQLSNVIS